MTQPQSPELPAFDPMTVLVCRFIENRPVFSRLIAWYTDSLWSHCEFGTPVGTWIGAHLAGGIQERPHDYCHPRREARYGLPVRQSQLDAFLKDMRADIGIKYNVPAIAGLAIHDRKLTNVHERICSQWMSRKMLKWFGAPLTWNLQEGYAHLMTPDMVHLSPIFVGRKLPQPYV